MSRTSSTSSAIIRFLRYTLLIGLCVGTSARAAVDKTSSIEASGEGSVYDLRATAAGTLRVCTKARKAGDRWRVIITQAITAGGVSGVGTGSTAAFTGCVSQTIAVGVQYLVIVTWERPMPGVFPASVIVHFTGPTDATNPPVVGITGAALTVVLARPTSFVETAPGCPTDGATIACGALITCRFDSASDTDAFRFSVPANSVASVRICGPTAVSSWQVFDPAGRVVTGAFGDGLARLSAAGVYTVVAQDCRGDVGPYSLSLEGVSQAYQCALPIAFTQTKSGTFDACADVDTYRFTCKASQVVRISIAGPSAGTAWNLLGPDGAVIAGAAGTAQATCLSAGTHVIKVFDGRGDTGAYSVTLQALTL